MSRQRVLQKPKQKQKQENGDKEINIVESNQAIIEGKKNKTHTLTLAHTIARDCYKLCYLMKLNQIEPKSEKV